MTRINIIDPSELMDQHLIAEIREINQLAAHFERSLKSKSGIFGVPERYKLSTSHVKFFYPRGLYLKKRFDSLVKEAKKRGFKIQTTFNNTWLKNDAKEYYNDYTPDEIAYSIIRERIKQKIDMKPDWYRYYGKKIKK